MRGFVFEVFAEPNPLGTWCKMMAQELGIKQDYLASLLSGSSRSAVATMFMPDRQGPSFATPAAGIIMDTIIEEEKRQWRKIWGRHVYGRLDPTGDPEKDYVRYPSSRPRVVRQAAFALSLWNIPEDDLRDRNREFFELLPMLDRDVYAQMVHMLCEPYFGMIISPKLRKPRKAMPGPTQMTSDNMPYNLRSARKAAVDLVLQAEGDPMRDEIFDTKVRNMISEGNRHGALQLIMEQLEGVREERDEQYTDAFAGLS